MPSLDPDQVSKLLPAETSAFPSPIPTQFVSSDEFRQREVSGATDGLTQASAN